MPEINAMWSIGKVEFRVYDAVIATLPLGSQVQGWISFESKAIIILLCRSVSEMKYPLYTCMSGMNSHAF